MWTFHSFCNEIHESLFQWIESLNNHGESSFNPFQCSVCGPATAFLTSKISYFQFHNFIHKTETGTPKRWETTNSNSYGSIKPSGQNLQQVLRFAVPFANLTVLCKSAGRKHVCWGKPTCFDFFPSKTYWTVLHQWSSFNAHSLVCELLETVKMQ